jgi:hypothetical protein
MQYLFNSSGSWIAFRVGKYIFDINSNWIGWLPWDEYEIVDLDGNYLGHIHPNNRLYKKYFSPYRGYPGFPGYPGYPGFPGYPGYIGYSPLPPGTSDVTLESI